MITSIEKCDLELLPLLLDYWQSIVELRMKITKLKEYKPNIRKNPKFVETVEEIRQIFNTI